MMVIRKKTIPSAMVAEYLLEYGEGKLNDMMEKIKFPRPTLWWILERMIEDCLVIKVRREGWQGSNTYYVTDDTVLEALEEMTDGFVFTKGRVWQCGRSGP